jgi:serine/threonine protein phosphatase 1
MREFVIGDIHGAHKALVECLERSSFDVAGDRLFILGDVCDGWSEVPETIEMLLTIKNRIVIRGNHDEWTREWIHTGRKPFTWIAQGGAATLAGYSDDSRRVPQSHKDFLDSGCYFYEDVSLEGRSRLFVHGGMSWTRPLSEQKETHLCWDRQLIHEAYIRSLDKKATCFLSDYDEIYVGHTPTQLFKIELPVQLCNVWALDTGAGWNGKLSIMDLQTKQFWQSDKVSLLYPNEKGRLR